MAFTPYHSITYDSGLLHNNVTAGSNIELIAPGEESGEIDSIMMTNTHATSDCIVTLFLQNQPIGSTFTTITIIKKIIIPAGVSLLLDESKLLSFENEDEYGYGLYLTLSAVDGTNILDIIISLQ
jgi:hypothetical protein